MRRALRVTSALLFVGVIAACGGSSSMSGAPAASTTTTTAAATVTVTSGDAAKAALQLADVGTGFASYRKAGGVAPIGSKSCSVTVSGAVLTPNDQYYNGAMFKKKDGQYFAYSEVYMFRDDATAKQYAAFRSTPAFKQCKQHQDDTATRAARPGLYVRLSPVNFTDPKHDVLAMYREYVGNVSSGKRVDNGFYDRYTLRRGPVVVVVYVDSALAKDDAASNALSEQTGTILRSLDGALATRVGSA